MLVVLLCVNGSSHLSQQKKQLRRLVASRLKLLSHMNNSAELGRLPGPKCTVLSPMPQLSIGSHKQGESIPATGQSKIAE